MASSAPHNWKHDVYPSFHGADVRKTILRHIVKELRSKGIDVFIHNNNKSIGPELIEGIRGSRIAIVMLSKKYASSTRCLNELAEIIKCREELGQTVMPQFYEVDPTDVKKQTGYFGKAFIKNCKGKGEEEIRRWKHALAEVAQIAGYHSTNWNNEAEVIEDIVADVWNKLINPISSSDFRGLVGMGDHLKKIEQLVRPDLDEVRFIGICGLPGIGKTTIANYINQRHSHHFQLSTVINIKGGDPRTFHEAKLHLQNQLYSQLISQTDAGESSHLGVAQERFKDKKILVVLDDVDQLGLGQLEVLAKELRGFGPGSRIIMTSQDPSLLKAQGIKHIYKVGFPASDEALRIFCMYAFRQKSPYVGFEKLAREITALSGELPAGLRFMGSYFRGKPKEEWENELPRLMSSVDGGFGSILKFTYDSLSGEDKKLAHHYISSLRDVDLTERMEKFLRKGLLEVRPTLTITNHDIKKNVNTRERAFKGASSNGGPHPVSIYCAEILQYSFASHLSLDFQRKGIDASVNCDSTLGAIEGAGAFVVVLSKNYFSSPSCLDKLVWVLQCRKKHFQLVVPVFYGISPSDVTVQEQESDDRITEWTSALQELRELRGIHSREESSDCEFVEEIVEEVYEKLFPMQQIGINSRLLEIKHLLCKQPWGIRCIGIWGMPGIGKTTLAKAFFDQISGGYESSCFIKYFDKAFREKGLYRLWDEYFGKILKGIPRVSSSITRPSLPEEKRRKRTLVVLDDVQNPLAAESFLKGFHWFGPGSLIIITSRDKRVFRLCQISHVYEVKGLNENEALRLLSQCAFGEDIREQNLLKLSKKVNDYANGNPLALSFYCGRLKGKNLSESNMIHDLLKSSYETLNDNEKDIFLDIACFFKGDDVGYVKQMLEGCGLFPHVGIDVLVEKSLVTISKNRVEMHGMIQDFGREINNKETTWIKRGRRLWEPSTIKFLLEDEKIEAKGHPKATCKGALVTEDIKAISLDTTNLRFDVKPTAFKNMVNLRFLKIYCCKHKYNCGLFLPIGLDSLPYGLRLLHWENYPLKSLPQDFDPGHLLELNMPYSELQKLWSGTKNLDMLKMVRLCHSQQLTEIDDFCNAQNIELIDLQGCTKLQSFPATGQLQHLRVVNLSGCREIKSLPEFSPNIEELNLQGTAIRELQISTSLKKLYLTGCSSLVQLPSSIWDASNLEILDLGNCSSLKELPSSIQNATNLEQLNLEYCVSLVELPSSLGNATNLKKLCLRGCLGLVKLPSSIGNAISIQELNLEYCSSLVELPSSFGNATNLKRLYLTGCSSLAELPSSIRNSTSLISIDLNDDNSRPIVTVSDNSGSRCVEVRRAKSGKFCVLESERMNEHCVSLIFHFFYKNERPMSFYIPFYHSVDTAYMVSRKMIARFNLDGLFVTFIAQMVDIVLVNLIPAWKSYVAVDYLIHSELNQNSRSHRNEGKTRREEESVFQDYASASHSGTLEEEDKHCVDETEEKEGSSSEEAEANKPVSLEEEERLRQEMDEIEAKYREEMKEIERKREEAIMQTKKKLSQGKQRQS